MKNFWGKVMCFLDYHAFIYDHKGKYFVYYKCKHCGFIADDFYLGMEGYH